MKKRTYLAVAAVSAMILFTGRPVTVAAGTDPTEVASQVKNMSYIGDQTYPLSAGRDENNQVFVSSVGLTGILSALEMDIDEDGDNEIFTVSYESSALAAGQNTIWFSILKENEGNWDVLAEAEIIGQKYGDTYYDVSYMDGGCLYYEGSVFLRKYNGKYEIFYEYYGEGMFATGQTWFLKGFQFDSNTLVPLAETEDIFYEDSPINMLWTCTYDELAGYSETYAVMMKNYCALGFQYPNINFGQMTVDQNPNLYQILHMRLGSDSSEEEVASLFSKGSSLDTLWYLIEDYSKDWPKNIEEFQSQQDVVITSDSGVTEEEAAEDISEYLLPDSNTRYLSEAEVAALDTDTLQKAINEIYARHGRVFATEENDVYFRSKSWYQPMDGKTDEQIESEFNEFEKANVDLMNRYR